MSYYKKYTRWRGGVLKFPKGPCKKFKKNLKFKFLFFLDLLPEIYSILKKYSLYTRKLKYEHFTPDF